LSRMKAKKNKRSKKERRRGKNNEYDTKRRSAKKSRGKKNDMKKYLSSSNDGETIELSISDTADVVIEDAEVKVEQPEWFSSEVGVACDNCCHHQVECVTSLHLNLRT
jgi:hypothetical protein